jgi:hypothetical protein
MPAAAAEREVTARVTEEDIRAGQQFATGEGNPIVMAVIRALGLTRRRGGPKAWWVEVGGDWWSLRAGAFFEMHDLGQAEVDWLHAFDAGEDVPPVEFTFTTRWAA